MVAIGSTDHLLDDTDIHLYVDGEYCTEVSEAGNLERRKRITKRLLRKLDLRVSFLVLVYIMNNVGSHWCP